MCEVLRWVCLFCLFVSVLSHIYTVKVRHNRLYYCVDSNKILLKDKKIDNYTYRQAKSAIWAYLYEQALQKTNQEIYKIIKTVRKRGNKSLVKWFGAPWIV